MGELTLCITPSGDGVRPGAVHSADDGQVWAGGGEGPGRPSGRAGACYFFGLSCEVSAELFSLTDSGAAMVAAVPLPGRALSSAGCNAGQVVLSSSTAFTRPAPSGWCRIIES